MASSTHFLCSLSAKLPGQDSSTLPPYSSAPAAAHQGLERCPPAPGSPAPPAPPAPPPSPRSPPRSPAPCTQPSPPPPSHHSFLSPTRLYSKTPIHLTHLASSPAPIRPTTALRSLLTCAWQTSASRLEAPSLKPPCSWPPPAGRPSSGWTRAGSCRHLASSRTVSPWLCDRAGGAARHMARRGLLLGSLGPERRVRGG